MNLIRKLLRQKTRSRILSQSSVLASLVLAASAVAAQTPINFETQGCNRLPQQAYYRTEFHDVNICLGEANLQMVVTDNDGLGRERVSVKQQGDRYAGVSQWGTAYTLDSKTLTIQYAGQDLIRERVVRMSTANQKVGVSGTVTYRQRSALPPNAIVEVKLVDVSRADAPAITIAEQTITTDGKQVPFPFMLTYDPSVINPSHRYAVQARISVDGQLRFINTSSYRVITQGAPNRVEVIVQPVAGR